MISDRALVCAKCDWENPHGSRFCNQCGIELAHDAGQAPPQENGRGAPDRASDAAGQWQDAHHPVAEHAEQRLRRGTAASTQPVEAATRLRPPRLSWPPITLAPLASRAAGSFEVLRTGRARTVLIGVVAVLAASVLLSPVIWNAVVPALRQVMIQFPLQWALLAAAALVVVLVAGRSSARAADTSRAPEPAPVAGRAAKMMGAARAAWRAPGGLVFALALAAVAEGLLLTGSILPGIVCYGVAALIACLKAITTPFARGPELGTLARRYEVPLALLVLGLSAFLRFFMIGSYPPGIEGDEIKWNASILDFMIGETGRWPASYFWDQGPLSFVYMPFFFDALGPSIASARIAVATLSTVGNVAFYFLARRALGVPAGLVAALLLGVSLGDLAASRDGHVETQVKLWVVLAPFFAAWAVDRVRAWQPAWLDRAAPLGVRALHFLVGIGPVPLLYFLAGASLVCGLLVFETFAPIAMVVGLYLGITLLALLVRASNGWSVYLLSGVAFALPILIGTPRILRVLYVRGGQHEKFDQAWGPDLLPSPEHVQLVLNYVGKNLNEFMASLFVQQRMGDFILNRPGPWENAALLPLLVVGFGWCLGRLRHRHNGLIILWAVLAPIPGAIILGWAAYRIAYPVAPALCLLMAIGLWVSFQALVASSPRNWKPALTAGMVGLLGLAVLANSHIYFRELPSYDDRMQMRELIDLVAQNVAPGRVLFMAAVDDRPDFVRNNHEMSQFTARGVVGVQKEPELLRQLPYVRLLPSLLLLRGRDMEARVIFESRFDIGPQPQEILNVLRNCFPSTSIQELRFTTMYSIPREAIASTRCALDTRT